MGVEKIFQRVTDGGRPQRHHECRVCGQNLDGDAAQCPDCGGEVAVYEL
jgi:rubrerythrin